MKSIKIDRTSRTPEIEFDFDNSVFAIRGESYPENVVEFYGPLISELENYFSNLGAGASIEFDFDWVYFNSSTAKVVMSLFESLERVARHGANTTVCWYYDADNDMMKENGEEFAEELTGAKFVLIEKGK